MSTEPAPDGWVAMATTPCPVCGRTVPRGAFCGVCGAHLSAQRGDGPDWLRIRAYGAAPGEHLLRLSVVSSLFPHLPHSSRPPFRVGLVAVILALVVFALLRWQPPLIAISALGLPLLFLTYLQESDVFDDLPIGTLLVTAALGVGLGVGWVVLTRMVVARTYGVAPGAGMAWERIREGLTVHLGGAVLMLVPVVLVRMSRPAIRESLDGFVIGSLGAISFTAAATLTRLAPQLATGMVARHRPIGGLLVEAGIRGVAMPLTAAAAGGTIGAALWFRRRVDIPQRLRGHALAAVVPGLVVLIVYAGLGLIDVAPLPQGMQLGLYMVITVLALLALRVVLHMALRREERDPGSGAPLLCPNCDHVIPDMVFCPNCGVATNASSRSSRNARRLARPVHTDTKPAAP